MLYWMQVKSNSSVLYFFHDLMKHLQVIFVPSCYLDKKTSNFVVFNYSVLIKLKENLFKLLII